MLRNLMAIISMLVLPCLLVIPALAQRPTPPPPPGGGGNQNQAAPEFDASYQPVENTYTGIGSVTIGQGEEIDDFSLTTALYYRHTFCRRSNRQHHGCRWQCVDCADGGKYRRWLG